MAITDIIINKLIESLGISRDAIDKIQTVIDNVDIEESEDELKISISLKNINITIRK